MPALLDSQRLLGDGRDLRIEHLLGRSQVRFEQAYQRDGGLGVSVGLGELQFSEQRARALVVLAQSIVEARRWGGVHGPFPSPLSAARCAAAERKGLNGAPEGRNDLSGRRAAGTTIEGA